MTEKENKDFILILFDIGENFKRSEYLFRIIKIIIEISSSEFPEKYWEFENIFSEEEIN
jgi:hypothetical protein